jgi:hypothetical protein
MSATRHLPLLVLALALACEDPNPPQSLYYDGDHLEVWASEGLEACNGTFPYMEAWLSAFRERVGRPDSAVRHTFYWLSPEEFDVAPCTNAVACASPRSNVIYSSFVPAEHELVHTELEGRPPSFLREGAAEAFGCTDRYNLVNEPSIESLADERQILRPDYQAAGRFSRFLIDRFGVDAYLDLYAGLEGIEGSEGLATGIADILEEDLSSLVADFEQRSTCRLEAWRFYDVECSVLPLVAWQDPDHWSATVDLACETPDVIGPRNDIVWARRALHVPETDRYTLSIETDDPSAVATIFSCQATCKPRDELTVVMIPAATIAYPTTLVLDAGRHWLRIEQAVDVGAPVTVHIER